MTAEDAEAGKCRTGRSAKNQARDEMRRYISSDRLRAPESQLSSTAHSLQSILWGKKKETLPIIRNPILFQFAAWGWKKTFIPPFPGCHVEAPSLNLYSYGNGCVCTENFCLCDFFSGWVSFRMKSKQAKRRTDNRSSRPPFSQNTLELPRSCQ